MNKIFDTYLNICHNTAPTQGFNSLTQTYLNKICKPTNIVLEAETEEAKKPVQVTKPVQKKQTPPKGEADLNFSVDLATEFSNTVNQFTLVCSKIVQNRVIDKDTSDKVYNLMGKIKDLLDAAGKTE